MTEEQILEGNILIAKFMGYIDNGDPEYLIHPETNYDHSVNDPECFLYHKSWNWLMPVIDKINDINDLEQPYVNIFPCAIEIANRHRVIAQETGHQCVDRWRAVLTFVQWYNNLPKNS